MTHTVPGLALRWTTVVLASIALGVGVAVNLQVSFLLVLAFLGVAALTAPTGAWVLSALVAALSFRGLVELNLLPSVATFVDLPLAWGALGVGLLKQEAPSPLLNRLLSWLGALALAVALAWAFHPSEALRPVLYLALLGEPFAIVGALLADPPGPRMRRALERTLLILVVIQIPIAALELVTLGGTDHIQGTLYGAGAGAHVISGIVVVGAFWILAGGMGRSVTGMTRIAIVAALMLIPFVADAKQVVLALPALLLAAPWSGRRLLLFGRIALVAGSVVALFILAPAGNTTEHFIEQSAHGQGGKEATGEFVWHHLRGDPGSIAFGLGPAETVSRAAFMTTDLFQRGGSPLASLGLKPAAIALEAQGAALEASGGGTSFNGGTSSALGVLGDLGFLGLLAYAGLLISLFLPLRRERSPEGVAAAAGFAMFIILGLFFDWWEQPPFAVFIAVLAGLSLTRKAEGQEVTAQPEAVGAAPSTP